MSTKSIGLILLVGGFLAVSAVAAWIYPHPVAAVTAPDTKAVPVVQSTTESSPTVEAADPEDTQLADVEPTCIWGVSKNLCGGWLTDGKWTVTQCGKCVNLVGMESMLKVRVFRNLDSCCDYADIPCDETGKLVGVLVAKGEYHIRLNEPCPVRGWWQTPWDWYYEDGSGPIARGWLDGTIGTGTHRVPLCPIFMPSNQRCGDKCETCYMAEFDGSSEPGRWIIHVEGSMVGEVGVDEYAGCQVRVTMQGFFIAPADEKGLPIPPDKLEQGWAFCGTVDGVLDCPCK